MDEHDMQQIDMRSIEERLTGNAIGALTAAKDIFARYFDKWRNELRSKLEGTNRPATQDVERWLAIVGNATELFMSFKTARTGIDSGDVAALENLHRNLRTVFIASSPLDAAMSIELPAWYQILTLVSDAIEYCRTKYALIAADRIAAAMIPPASEGGE